MAKSDKSKQNQMLVRYGNIGYVGLFGHDLTELPTCPTRVVIKTDRGLEIGTLIGTANSRKGNFNLNCNSLEDYYQTKQGEYPLGQGGKFVRVANEQDLSEEKHINGNAKDEMKRCQELARELGLEMKVVDCEHIFGGERIVFYFLSDGRVDFRELVKNLAREFQTRIEMRQIGARDEARLISDIETCGQPCCCRQFLKVLKPVNMRMAKVQKATLDPSKISGHCGRLRCCLRYEDETYTELKKRLPNRSSRVKTSLGTGQVIDVQIITQLVMVRHEDGSINAFNVDDIEVLPKTDKSRQAAGKEKGVANKNRSKNNSANASNSDTDKNQGRRNNKQVNQKPPKRAEKQSESSSGNEEQPSKRNRGNEDSRNQNKQSEIAKPVEDNTQEQLETEK